MGNRAKIDPDWGVQKEPWSLYRDTLSFPPAPMWPNSFCVQDRYQLLPVPSPVGWWACITRLTPCVSTSVFDPSHDFCVMVQLLSPVYYNSASCLEDEYTSGRLKREPVSLTLAMLMGGRSYSGSRNRGISLN